MRNLTIGVRAGLILAMASGGTGSADPLVSKGRVDAVTVYRGQALVTREVDVTGAPGLAEVVVTELPSRVLPGSLYAESADGVSVRSVQFRTRPVAQDVREDVRKLDNEILALTDSLAEAAAGVERLHQQKAYLDKLENFVAPTAQVELSKGVLNAETLTTMADYTFKQREEVGKKMLDLTRKMRDVQDQIGLRTREREKLTAGSARTVQEAVVFLNKSGAGAAKLRVRYLVDAATWTPSYNARAEVGGNAITLEYFASVEQMSGEDWGNVTLELSTATPALSAKAPTLHGMIVALAAAPQQAQAADKRAYSEVREELSKKQRDFEQTANARFRNFVGMVETGAGNAPRLSDVAQADAAEKDLNLLASQVQLLDVIAEEQVARKQARSASKPVEEGVSVTYQVSGRTSLPSRNDAQLIQIASFPMKAEFTKLASPVLTQFVYDEAHLINTSGQVLLAGPVTAYRGGSFVGNSDVRTITSGEQLSLGFGIDSGLRSAKELVEKTEKIQGGNRVVELTYRLIVENFSNAPSKIRLVDRLPKARESEIKVTLVGSSKDPIAESEETGAKDKKSGLMRWDLDLPAQSVGAKSVTVEYTFRLEYDKQMTVVGTEAVGAERAALR
jgi:hypothetical protein